jgi:PPOX class probable F420-dependent enzyme
MLDLTNPRDAGIAARLPEEEFAYFTSVRPDGSPHTVAVCFLWEDESSILVFSQPNNVKVRNVRQNPHVSLALDNFGQNNTPVVVEGAAALVDEPGVEFTMPAYATKYTPLAQRLGVTIEGMGLIYTQAIRITPAKIRQDQ